MEFLQKLKLQKENHGTSTGNTVVESKGELILSFSPVDNELIGAVSTTDHKAYEQVITKEQSERESSIKEVKKIEKVKQKSIPKSEWSFYRHCMKCGYEYDSKDAGAWNFSPAMTGCGLA